jgi:hypothetical protein
MGEPDYHDLTGLVYREGDRVVFDGARCASSFSLPPRLEDLDLPKYAQAGFGLGVLTKLGSFNYPSSATEAQKEAAAWRVIRPIPEVVQEVKDLHQRLGLRKVFFIDNGFNIPLAHAKDLCRALIDADLDLRWNTPLAPYGCDPELIGLMKQAGCALTLMGGLRGDSHEGDSLDQRLEPVAETCRLCEGGGLHYSITMMFGEPGDTRQTVEKKLAFLRGLNPAMANLRIGVSILPGTGVAKRAVEEGLVRDESELIRPTFYIAPEVREWLVDHLKAEAAGHPRWNLL